MKITQTALSILFCAALAGCKSSTVELEPTPPERTDIVQIVRTIPPHESLPGSTARTALLFTQAIPGLGAHIEVREYYVSQGSELALTPTSEAVFEVRSGLFEISAPGVKGEHTGGTTWTAAPGERVLARTTGEIAILRAIYVVKD